MAFGSSLPVSPAGPCPPGIQVAELPADLLGIGVIHLVQDRQGLPPGAAGGPWVGGIVAGVPEAGESAGVVVTVADGLPKAQRPIVGGDGLPVVAELMLGEADAIQAAGLVFAVAYLPSQVKGLAAMRQGWPS
jgi:hypothetical protein